MIIIVYRDTYGIIRVVEDCFNMPKLFSCESEAIDFIDTKEIYAYQLLEVTI